MSWDDSNSVMTATQVVDDLETARALITNTTGRVPNRFIVGVEIANNLGLPHAGEYQMVEDRVTGNRTLIDCETGEPVERDDKPARVLYTTPKSPSPTGRRHTYMDIKAIGSKGKTIAAKGQEAPPFPNVRKAVGWFRFATPVECLTGERYWVRLWEDGKSYATSGFITDEDTWVDTVVMQLARPGLKTARCWVTIETDPEGRSDHRRSGTLMLKG